MSFFAQRSDTSEFRKRFRWIALVMVIGFFVILGRLFQLQILEGAENRALAIENVVRKVTLATTRGRIVDKNGKVLADSRASYNVYVVPKKIDMAVTWPKLAGYEGDVAYRVRVDGSESTIHARATGWDTTAQFAGDRFAATYPAGPHTITVEQSVFGGPWTTTGTGTITSAATAPYLACGSR